MSNNVMLFYEQVPHIEKATLLEALRKRCGRVESLNPDDKSESLAFVYLDHLAQYQDKEIPVSSLTLVLPSMPAPDSIVATLQQSWDWPEARETVARCRAMVGIHDVMADALDYKERLALFHNIVLSVMEVAPCAAIHWIPSQRIVNPQSYIHSKNPRAPEGYAILYPAVNVRYFNIRDRSPGEKIMDTVGMGAFGLPDLQCHFIGLDPDALSVKLYNTAYYIYDEGDIIQDRNTLEGIEPGQKWVCHHEASIVGPEREVLDINPGPQYTKGIRG
jgi:hypothetical protein